MFKFCTGAAALVVWCALTQIPLANAAMITPGSGIIGQTNFTDSSGVNYAATGGALP